MLLRQRHLILSLLYFLLVWTACKKDNSQEILERANILKYLQESGYTIAYLDSIKRKSGVYVIFDKKGVCQDTCTRACSDSQVELKYSIYSLKTLSEAGILADKLLMDYPSTDSLRSVSLDPLLSNYGGDNFCAKNENLPLEMQVALTQEALFTKGSSALVFAPSHLAYGTTGHSGVNHNGDTVSIPRHTTIVYYLELIDIQDAS